VGSLLQQGNFLAAAFEPDFAQYALRCDLIPLRKQEHIRAQADLAQLTQYPVDPCCACGDKEHPEMGELENVAVYSFNVEVYIAQHLLSYIQQPHRTSVHFQEKMLSYAFIGD